MLAKSSIANLLKQAQQVQENLKQAQESLAELEAIGEAGAGMVRVTMDGKHLLKRVQIDPALLGESRDMLEDLIVAATNDATRRIEHQVKERMEQLTGGLSLPEGFKLPF